MSTVTKKYQTTIPPKVREELGIEPGDRVTFIKDKCDHYVVKKIEHLIDEVCDVCSDIEETIKKSRKGFKAKV